MDIIGNIQFVQIPGSQTIELPPLDLKTLSEEPEVLIEEVENSLMLNDYWADPTNMAAYYSGFYKTVRNQWWTGNTVLEWAECVRELLEEENMYPRDLLSLIGGTIWPGVHQQRLAKLILFKNKDTALEKKLMEGLGTRYLFRKFPGIDEFNPQFLTCGQQNRIDLCRNWLSVDKPVLPPERFAVEIIQ